MENRPITEVFRQFLVHKSDVHHSKCDETGWNLLYGPFRIILGTFHRDLFEFWSFSTTKIAIIWYILIGIWSFIPSYGLKILGICQRTAVYTSILTLFWYFWGLFGVWDTLSVSTFQFPCAGYDHYELYNVLTTCTLVSSGNRLFWPNVGWLEN